MREKANKQKRHPRNIIWGVARAGETMTK